MAVLEIDMVVIPEGTFLMGGSADDKYAGASERPRREQRVASFALARFPVAEVEGDRPRVDVSWDEAVAYCASLGPGYRLPTEVEWEYACRAGSSAPYPGGDLPDPERINFFYDVHGNRVGPGRRLPLGWGAPNAFGLHDMLGNVCEWVADDWRKDYESVVADPEMKTLRGGAWDYLPSMVRSSWRDGAHRATRRDNLGFRVARSLGEWSDTLTSIGNEGRLNAR